MRKTWEKLVQHVGTKYGQDIRNEMQNKTVVNITEHLQAPQVLLSHATQKVLVYTVQNNIQVLVPYLCSRHGRVIGHLERLH